MDKLDKFGEFLVKNFYNKTINQQELLLKGQLRGKNIQRLQDKISSMSEDQRVIVREVIIDSLNVAMHDLLFAIQDAHDRELGIEVLVDGVNVAEQSKMLNGEHLGDEGWIKRYGVSN